MTSSKFDGSACSLSATCIPADRDFAHRRDCLSLDAFASEINCL